MGASAARRSTQDLTTVEFRKVTVIPSGDTTLYEFAVSGQDLTALGKIRRFADETGGVQRQSRAAHIKEIAKAMAAGCVFQDSITANLAGDWIVDQNTGTILGDPATANLEIIDGQHRLLALQALKAGGRSDIVAKYTFLVVATLNATDAMRRSLFLSQDKRLRIEGAHALELRAEANAFVSEAEERSYRLLRRLNTDDRSPFKGRIIFGDAKDDRGRNNLRDGNFGARSFLYQLRPIMSNNSRSPLSHLSHVTRADIVVNLFAAAAEQYNNFGNPEHVLGQPLGFTALLAILSMDGEFHMRLASLKEQGETGYEQHHIRRVFAICQRFMWRARGVGLDSATKSPAGIARRFNDFLRDRREQPKS